MNDNYKIETNAITLFGNNKCILIIPTDKDHFDKLTTKCLKKNIEILLLLLKINSLEVSF